MIDLVPGLVGETETLVTEALTARHLGSGKVSVLATPSMIMLMEQAAVAAVEHLLPTGQQTVGIHVDVRHLAATPQGMKVHARAELLEVEGRRLKFRVEAFDEREKVGEGFHERAIIQLNRFEQKVAAKWEGN